MYVLNVNVGDLIEFTFPEKDNKLHYGIVNEIWNEENTEKTYYVACVDGTNNLDVPYKNVQRIFNLKLAKFESDV